LELLLGCLHKMTNKQTKWEKDFKQAQKEMKERDPIGTHPLAPIASFLAVFGLGGGFK